MNPQAYFTPPHGIAAHISAQLATAKTTIHIVMYEFDSQPLSLSLELAAGRGVAVELVLDRTEAHASRNIVAGLKQAGVKLYSDSKHDRTHSKYVIGDSGWVITGSYNWTNDAELRNAENIVVIDDAVLAAAYEQDFNLRLNESTPL